MKTIEITEKYISEKIKKRPSNAHKGNFGKILVFAGSIGMAGAGILCARAALRSGAGLVRFLLSNENTPLYPIYQNAVPEATCVFKSDFSSEKPINYNEYDAIVAGPGLGADDFVLKEISELLEKYSGTLVLDADALNAVSHSKELQEKMIKTQAKCMLTPHIGEARRLLGNEKIQIKTEEERIQSACTIGEKYKCTTILKGEGTLIYASNLDNLIYKNTTGNPGMATGGSGDVLAGIIASLAGQGHMPEEAANIGVYIHGLAGDLAAEELGEISMLSSDIEKYICKAFKKFC